MEGAGDGQAEHGEHVEGHDVEGEGVETLFAGGDLVSHVGLAHHGLGVVAAVDDEAEEPVGVAEGGGLG